MHLRWKRLPREVEGIKDAAVAFMAQKMSVDFEDGADADEVMAKVVKACKKVESDCEIYLD